MDKKERFLATINREMIDRPAWWLGLPTKDGGHNLRMFYGANDMITLKLALNDDVWPVEMPYQNGTTNAIYAAFNFAKAGDLVSSAERTLTSPGFFEDYENVADVDRFDWPSPESYISREACRHLRADVPKGYPVLGVIWSAHFQDACAAFGMEDALIKMKTAPGLFREVIDRIVRFYLRANEIFYEYTKGSLDAVLIGNDFGSQSGLMVSPSDLREFVFGGTKLLIEQAKSYGLKVIHHSCGSIEPVISDLIDCGADVIHPIQALATGMEPEKLKIKYGDSISFCGGVDAQNLLVHGSAIEVRNKVLELCEIFPTGLIISPSHEAILPDVPAENIDAIKKAMESLDK